MINLRVRLLGYLSSTRFIPTIEAAARPHRTLKDVEATALQRLTAERPHFLLTHIAEHALVVRHKIGALGGLAFAEFDSAMTGVLAGNQSVRHEGHRLGCVAVTASFNDASTTALRRGPLSYASDKKF